MATQTFSCARSLADDAIGTMLPMRQDVDWLRRFVDAPRFGWDWAALEQGFFGPLRVWADEQDARLRPALAALMMDALGSDASAHPSALAALELHYLASIMLDDLRNGRDLSHSTDASVAIPLPVWVTIAYNARQLAPVLVMRSAEPMLPRSRRRLAQRFAAFLFRQGIGSTLDLRLSEQEIEQACIEDLVAHLSLYVGPLSFGLCAETAAVVAGLDDVEVDQLSAAANQLGVAARLQALSSGEEQHLLVNGMRSREQRLRWRGRHPATSLLDAAAALQHKAIAGARAIHPPSAEVLGIFFQQMSQTASEART